MQLFNTYIMKLFEKEGEKVLLLGIHKVILQPLLFIFTYKYNLNLSSIFTLWYFCLIKNLIAFPTTGELSHYPPQYFVYTIASSEDCSFCISSATDVNIAVHYLAFCTSTFPGPVYLNWLLVLEVKLKVEEQHFVSHSYSTCF